MLEKRPSISVAQMVAMLFISRMMVTMTYGTLLIGDSDMWDHILSAAVSFVITAILVIPIYGLFSMDRKMNVLDNLQDVFGRFGLIFIVFYVGYYLMISAHTLAVFNNFMASAINPPMSLTFLSIAITGSACYGAYKGVEALARTSGFILIVMVLSMLFMGVSLFTSIETINYKPLLYDGTDSMVEGTLYMLSQATCIPAMAVLLPLARGKTKAGILVWNICIYGVTALMILLMVGTMGDFVKTQLFPVYTAAGIGKFGSFQHLDSLYLGIWTSGIFIKLSLFLMLAGEGVKKILGEKARKISVLIFSAMLVILTFCTENYNVSVAMFSTEFLLWSLGLIVVFIPLILIIGKGIKRKKFLSS